MPPAFTILKLPIIRFPLLLTGLRAMNPWRTYQLSLQISPTIQKTTPQHKCAVGLHGGDGAMPVVSSPVFVP